MPSTDTTSTTITHINEICYNARTTWYTYISVVLFVLLALLGVSDKDFFEFGSQMQLPLIEYRVPIVNFFVAGSTFILILYAYLHVKLEKLWRAIGAYCDGQARIDPAVSLVDRQQALTEQVYPWPVISASICPHNTAHGFQMVRFYITRVSFWISGPLAIGCFWFKSWAYHDEVLTLYLGILLTMALAVLCSSIQHVRYRMIRDYAPPRPWRRWTALASMPLLLFYLTVLALVTGYAQWTTLIWPLALIGLWLLIHAYRVFRLQRGWHYVDPSTRAGRVWRWGITVSAGAVIAILGWETTEGTLDCPIARSNSPTVERRIDVAPLMARQRFYCYLKYRGKTTFDAAQAEHEAAVSITVALGKFRYRVYNRIWHIVQEVPLMKVLTGLPPGPKDDLPVEAPLLWPADLRGAAFTDLPRNWVPWYRQQEEQDKVSVQSSGGHKDCRDSTVERLRANLLKRIPKRKQRHVDLRRADLTGAVLVGQNLEYARLDEAQLREANFELANLSDASLRNSNAERAAFPSAILSGADMHGIMLENAVLHAACMYDANLSNARLEDADMRKAIAIDVTFHGARLINIHAEGARFELAKLAKATLSGETLSTIDLKDTRLEKANLCRANLSGAQNIPSLNNSHGCANTTLPKAKPRPKTWHTESVASEDESRSLFKTWLKTSFTQH